MFASVCSQLTPRATPWRWAWCCHHFQGGNKKPFSPQFSSHWSLVEPFILMTYLESWQDSFLLRHNTLGFSRAGHHQSHHPSAHPHLNGSFKARSAVQMRHAILEQEAGGETAALQLRVETWHGNLGGGGEIGEKNHFMAHPESPRFSAFAYKPESDQNPTPWANI